MVRLGISTALTAMVFSWCAVRGQSPDTVRLIDTVVVRAAAAIPQKGIIPAQTLTQKDLETLNSFSVADAIRYFSGVQLKDYGGIGGIKTVNVRSMGTNHMGVFYDGVQLGNAQNGQVDLGKFSLDNVEEISLYNGQKSEIFQSARDFGSSGTIYITTRKPRFESGRQANMRATLRTGSFGLVNPAMLYEYRVSDRIATSFSGEWINADGKYRFRYRRRDTRGEIAYDTTAVRQNGDLNATRMEAGVHGTMDGGRWTLRAYTYNSERGIPGAVVNNNFRRGERLWDTNSFVQGTFRKDFAPWYKVLLNAKYAADYTHYENNDNREYQSKNTYRQKEIYVSAANLFTLAADWDVSLAYDFQWNTLGAEFAMPEKNDLFTYPTRYSQWVVGATAFRVWRLRVQASGLGYFVHERVKRHAASPDKAIFTPAVFVSVRPFDGADLSIRGFFKQMFRMPTFNDLYYTDMGNPYLKPEFATQLNVGFRIGFGKFFEFQADAYRNEVTDKIIAYPKGQQFRWTMLNLGFVRIEGVDVSTGGVLALRRGMSLGLKAQYTFQRARDFTNPRDTYYGHQIPYIPRHSGSAMASFDYRGWSVHYSFIYSGERYNQQENFYFNHVQPWYTSDAAVSKTIALPHDRSVKLTAELNNLFSQDYDVILNYPMPLLNYRFLIRIDL